MLLLMGFFALSGNILYNLAERCLIEAEFEVIIAIMMNFHLSKAIWHQEHPLF
jgi:hypothetical protein